MIETAWKVLTRKKVLDPVSAENTQLGRVLNTYDLTALGVGSTLGVGVYVLAGHVAKDTAGPAVVLSFLIATIASVFAGLCYAEFGARAPRAGSAYIYSYVCVGEFIAFVIGWNLILEYIIGSASVARGLSLYLDTLLNHTLENTFREIAPINLQYMSDYFDFFAFGISVILSIALAFGMKESSMINNIFTIVNLGVVLFVIIAGSIKADPKNWNLDPPANHTHVGTGGFFPFGVEGMIKGAATCFYGFVGFDCIATTGEEVKNPKRAIPISIVLSLFIIFLAYFGTSTVVTMMLPYYDQDPDAPIPFAFESIGWTVPKWIVAIGGIFGLCASLFGAMFPLPRILYAMASDGIIFEFLGKVSERFKTPVVGTLLAGLFTGLMAAMFELKQLVSMMSIGTLLAYTIVAASVLLLRFEVEKVDESYLPLPASDSEENEPYTENVNFAETDDLTIESSTNSVVKQIFNCGRNDQPTPTSEKLVAIEVCVYCVLCVFIGLCAMYLKTPLAQGEIWAITLTSIVVCVTVLVIMSIATQPKSRKELSFKVPLVPLIPALSILINIYLMLMLDPNTWIRFAVWMTIGIPSYYFSVKNQCKFAQNLSVNSSQKHSDNLNNGNVNLAFVAEEKPELFRIEKRKSIEKQENSVPTPAQQEAIAQLEDVIKDFDNDDSLSFISQQQQNNNKSHEKHVEADVHRSDSPTVTVYVDPSRPENARHEFIVQTIDIQPILFQEAVANVIVCENVSLVTPPPSPIITQAPSTQADFEKLLDEKINMPISNIPPPPPFINLLDDKELNKIITPAPPPKSPVTPLSEKDLDELILAHPPLLAALLDDEKMVIPRPKHNLKEVTLRPVRPKKRKAPEMPDDFDAGENNIKVSDPGSKQFFEKLTNNLRLSLTKRIMEDNHKAQRLNGNKPAISVQQENVIEDSIDTKDAKVKLAQFLQKENTTPEIPRKVFTLPRAELGAQRGEDMPAPDYDNREDDRDLHNRNMQDIFRSIRLKKSDKDQ